MSATAEGPCILGADGCPGGWIAVSHPLDQPLRATWAVFETFSKLFCKTTRHHIWNIIF